MGHSLTTAALTRQLATQQRVVVLGGFAVIAHGHSRPTYVADAWLDPGLSPEEWAKAVRLVLDPYPELRVVAIGSWEHVAGGELAEVVLRDEVVRVMGANQPLDIFRAPNELEMAEFDHVWERGEQLDDGTRIPDVIDLLVTKQATGREKDLQDVAFLEAKAERLYLARLPEASSSEALAMLDRFLTPNVAAAACRHSAAEVRAAGAQFLRELAEDGDPFARDLLATLPE